MQYYHYNTFLGKLNLWVVLPLLLLTACKDVFETNIENQSIVLLAPADSTHTATSLVQFKWEYLENVSHYRLQVVMPSFSRPERYLLDTLLTGTSFEYNLLTGSYEWQLRGENGNSKTPYARRTLFVDSITDISKQVIQAQLPEAEAATRNFSVLFKWNKVSLADYYELQLWQPDGNGVLVKDTIVNNNQITLSLFEGNFSWRVRGNNSQGSTVYTTQRLLYIDSTAPIASIPQSPEMDKPIDVSDFPYSFTWIRNPDNGSGLVYDSLLILKTPGNIIVKSALISNSEYSADQLAVGNYIWKLKTMDKAGNWSGFSGEMRFSVK